MAHRTQSQNSPQDFTDAHNAARALVGVGPISWDPAVAENLFWGMGREFNAADAANLWVAEQSFYNYSCNTCVGRKVCGHYTQIVWRNPSALVAHV
ncbi:hypothetical protein QJS10_CPA05g01683 [Acorus calamus]|uniref:SCP domain-containing protein n=1 Tax=Acorus calamus TaxID=4465 RepID=A0AAV9EX81_ACOCL|nr:hypothetical protein QJS10_CPA05g01683 [Acorus calamus]